MRWKAFCTMRIDYVPRKAVFVVGRFVPNEVIMFIVEGELVWL